MKGSFAVASPCSCVLLASVLAVAAAFPVLYDETVWTRQWQSLQLRFPAHLLQQQQSPPGFALSSLTGPYDPDTYKRTAEAESTRSVSAQLLVLLHCLQGACNKALLRHAVAGVAGRVRRRSHKCMPLCVHYSVSLASGWSQGRGL